MTDNKHPTYRGVLLHASAVEYGGKALVFLGPSETGKSTISQLLAATLEGARVLADDLAYLKWQNGQWQVVGDTSPNFQQEAFASLPVPISRGVPLGGVFRLFQAPLPRLEPLDNSKTGFYLMRALFEVFMHRLASIEEKRACFSSLSAVARWAPGYAYYFERSAQTTDALRREMAVVQRHNV
ncbi:MAG: hypothetical protein RBT75_14810 [Anaerolineae bacterium]|jgi:hypothetical protein|nr:hypothetical protein [Anaerolineae bacterium]